MATIVPSDDMDVENPKSTLEVTFTSAPTLFNTKSGYSRDSNELLYRLPDRLISPSTSSVCDGVVDLIPTLLVEEFTNKVFPDSKSAVPKFTKVVTLSL